MTTKIADNDTEIQMSGGAPAPSSNKDKFLQLIDHYKTKTKSEDIEYIQNEFQGSQKILQQLDTSLANGISESSVEKRKAEYGDNAKQLPERISFWALCGVVLEDLMLKILIVCAFVSIGVDCGFAYNDPEKLKIAWIEGAAILIAVVIVTLVSATSDYQKEGQFIAQQMLEIETQIVTVMRDGKVKSIHYDNIVVGDVIKIENGMNIPVDGIVLSSSGLMCDESAMTGESDHLGKESFEKCWARFQEQYQNISMHDPSPIFLSGTQVQTGEGWFIALVVGPQTCERQILGSVNQRDTEKTPLQKKLEIIALDIGRLGMYAAILIFHCLLLRSFIEGMIFRKYDLYGGELNYLGQPCIYAPAGGAVASSGSGSRLLSGTGGLQSEEVQIGNCDGQFLQYIKDYLHFIIVGIAIIVVAVPEGLPLAVMISLAYSVRKMLKDNNFVKKLTSCEIMGGANNICSDKTGTLTQNKMTWIKIYAGQVGNIQPPEEVSSYQLESIVPSKAIQDLIVQACSCNTIGTVENSQATEMAMLKFIDKCGIKYEELRTKYLGFNEEDFTRFHFDSSRKRMSTILTIPQNEVNTTAHGYNKRIHMKGASEVVLTCATHWMDAQGNRQVITDSDREKINQTIDDFAKNALRTIAFVYKDLAPQEGGKDHNDKADGAKIYQIEENGFTLICIAGIRDILRPEVPEAVQDCNTAGIRVRMITGDNKTTAIAIAKDCGIIKEGEENEEGVVFTGVEFMEYIGGIVDKETRQPIVLFGQGESEKREVIGNPDKMKIIRNKFKVMARSRPIDKYTLVKGLKDMGDIVAVTGDGTNDAMALKKANVGFAMRCGTNVAHNAADIIIQDDNFASIVKACSWGRNVYDNIRRFLQFQLTVNVVALATSFCGSVILWDSPLAAIQLLWVNLIMDSLASLALATEPPKPELLQRPPYRKREYIINQKMIKHILGQAAFQTLILFVFIFAGHKFIPENSEGPLNNDSNRGLTAKDYAAHPDSANLGWDGTMVMNGMMQGLQGNDIYKYFYDITPSRHMTVVFNLFVWFQVFNMLAARKINDEGNIFEGVIANYAFMVVWLIIAVGQVFIVQFGSLAMKVHIDGLTMTQWLICVGVGFLSLIWNLLLKYVPDDGWPTMGDESEEDVRHAEADYAVLKKIAVENREVLNKAK